ncbi:hypothetical protein [Burkholderia ubonensis]|uniref:hypothetical protein n=1 Tax=Burkholderia ubonensis TaxID=101571 RepID=UPI00076DC3F0|nr:hypothetical protein [Burkholderia ubonensis]KVV07320.1 hypothetical protein WK77_16145 [Burkholderia ubonensis]
MGISDLIAHLQGVREQYGEIDVAALSSACEPEALNTTRLDVVEDSRCSPYGMADGVQVPYLLIG